MIDPSALTNRGVTQRLQRRRSPASAQSLVPEFGECLWGWPSVDRGKPGKSLWLLGEHWKQAFTRCCMLFLLKWWNTYGFEHDGQCSPANIEYNNLPAAVGRTRWTCVTSPTSLSSHQILPMWKIERSTITTFWTCKTCCGYLEHEIQQSLMVYHPFPHDTAIWHQICIVK